MITADTVLRVLGSSTLGAFVGGYLDHVLTSSENAAMRQSLSDAKAAIEARDWPRVTVWVSATCERYFSVVFGDRLFSVRAVGLTFGYAFLIALLGLPRLEEDAHLTLTWTERLGFTAAVALPSAAVDLCILAWARRQLRTLASGAGRASPVLIGILGASYTGIGVAVLLAQIIGATVLPALLPGVAGGLPSPPLLYVLLAAPLTWPYILTAWSFDADPNTIVLVFPAALSGIIVSCSLLVTILIARSPRFIGGPIAAGLDRLGSSPKGIFATLGGAVGTVVNLVHDLLK